MSTKYSKHFSTVVTPQSEPIPGKKQVENSAGGFSFAIDDWARLDRFLILGSEGGSYYATEHELTKDNAQVVQRLLSVDGERVVARIVEISDQGRAPKNDPAIFALAMALKLGDLKTRVAAAKAVPKVCRIGTHIFQFAENAKAFGGGGSLYCKAIANWYLSQDQHQLAMNLVKYQNRNNWTHQDLLRSAHVKVETSLLRWAARKGDLSSKVVLRFKHGTTPADAKKAREKFLADGKIEDPIIRADSFPAINSALLPDTIHGFEEIRQVKTPAEAVKLIEKYGLPRETVPTELLNSVEVWDTLLKSGKGMPFTAMIRNLGKMSAVGLISPRSNAAKFIKERLKDKEGMKKARVHPIHILLAQAMYGAGHGTKGKLCWSPDQHIIDALDDAFYAAFGFVEPTGKRTMLALDVSGSMGMGQVAGTPLTPRESSSAMAMVVARTEPEHFFGGFTSGMSGEWQYGTGKSQHSYMGYGAGFSPLNISPKMRLKEVCEYTAKLPMGGTDCALPMLYALNQKMPIDVFQVYTDNETWAGGIHPVQALQMYRQQMGIPAKLVVVGMISNGFSIADPNDGGMLDVVGFDTATPQIMSEFSRS